MMETNKHALHAFHPLISQWFLDKYRTPTPIQEKAWERISAGDHLLLTAPTGSGKTLAAFLWAINQLANGCWATGQIRVLYVSPLKALNNDIRRNLISPLMEIKDYFNHQGRCFPKIHLRVRSGDTPQNERRRMLRHPPEILITTPETLNLILSSKRVRPLLTGIATVILDEVHAVADNKRGTHLISAVDRLVLLSGEFQRIGLSATIKPLQKVADFIAGYRMEMQGQAVIYHKRDIHIIQSGMSKKYDVRVSCPKNSQDALKKGTWWPALISEFVNIIQCNRSTLLFTNNRRFTEKITRLINEYQNEILAYSHHGSLSKELRHLVEQKLKRGELKAIVATSSLELGIDIGSLEEVILIQAPFSISAAVQRVGRAGHSVRETSQARIYPLHGKDLISCAVMAKAVMDKDIEEIHILESPLDVLAQIIVSIVGIESWDRDLLFHHLRASYPFHRLTPLQYDLVLEMLSGRYADSRIRELRPRISIDGIDHTIRGKDGVLRLLYIAGGTIPDRGYYTLRHSQTKAKIGELDEEFVWERRVGDTFTLGTQSWKIEKVDHQNIDVIPIQKPGSMAPFWRAESLIRNFYLSEKIALFLEEWNQKLGEENAHTCLKKEYYLEDEAAIQLIDFLKKQKKVTGFDLPHRHLLIIEHFEDPMKRADNQQVILHTLWGSQLNLPFSIALSQAWEERYHYPLQGFQENDCILLNLPHQFSAQEIFDLVTPENLHRLLRKKLEKTGFFGARFRENAERALLLPKKSFYKRMPLWLNRLRSKKLFHAVLKYEDFPILTETWRDCLQDEFDLKNLFRVLDEIREGIIAVKEVHTKIPSPFAESVIWQQTNQFVYEDDALADAKTSQLKKDIIEDLIFTPALRPKISQMIIEEFTQKIQRTYPGYGPNTPMELLDLLKERIMIPEPEWDKLLDYIHSKSDPIEGKICKRMLPGAGVAAIVAFEKLSQLEKALSGDEEILICIVSEWMQFYGPISKHWIQTVWGFDEPMLDNLLDSLINQRMIVSGPISENADAREYCDAQNLEILLRMARKRRRPEFKALDISFLPLFIVYYQGLTSPGKSIENLQNCLERLWGYPALAYLWETEVLPARIEAYDPSWLDTLSLESELIWFGCGREKVGFCFESDLEIFQSLKSSKHHETLDLFQGRTGKYNFWDLSRMSGIPSHMLTQKLWDMAWEGLISNDRIQTLRKGIENHFQANSLPPIPRRKIKGVRSHFNRWKASRPMAGNWYVLNVPDLLEDLMEKEEIIKDRIRVLFQRYGIIFREILAHELKELRWPSIFRSLRLMELSGEIIAGHFFDHISGMQFISHNAYREIQKKLPEDAIYWMNATDPASLCGVRIEALKKQLPARRPSTHVVFRGRKIVLVSRQRGRKLTFHVPPDDPDLPKYLKVFKVQLTRKFNPLKRIKVEVINEKPVAESPYKEGLIMFGFTFDYQSLVLR